MNYKKHNYFGREKELKILNEKYRSKTFEFITISGKSGDGKTALIKEFVEEKRAILFKAIRSNASHNYSALSKSIGELATFITLFAFSISRKPEIARKAGSESPPAMLLPPACFQ